MISSLVRRRVLVGTLSELASNGVLVARVAPDLEGRPREVIVVRDHEGVLRAYRNLCQHLPVPLDGGSREFLFEGHLLCGTHGALYRLDDGFCVQGPCLGSSLESWPVELEADQLFVPSLR